MAGIIVWIALYAGGALAAIPAGYVSYWPMDGTYADAAGLNNGTMTGGSESFVEGIRGMAAEMGSSRVVNFGTDPSLDVSGPFSIGGWVKWNTTGGYIGIQRFVDWSTWQDGFCIRQGGDYPGQWYVSFINDSSAWDTVSRFAFEDRWIHLMAVFDGDVLSLFRDGVCCSSVVGATPAPTTAALRLGKINAALDECVFYARALSGSEIGDLMATTHDTTAPVVGDVRAEELPVYSARISWTTDRLSTRELEYRPAGGASRYSRPYGDPLWYATLDTAHSVRLNGLVEATRYYYRIHARNSTGFESVTAWDSIDVAAPDPMQKMNLPAVSSPRITVPPDRVWPSGYGDAHVCLWADDKMCAVNLSTDDNWFTEKDWLLEMAGKYGFTMTWFIIPQLLDSEFSPSGKGTWDGWRPVLDAGHEIVSHAYAHCGSCEVGNNYYWGFDYEFTEAISAIDEHYGFRPLVLAYPGGAVADLVRPDYAKKYYIAGRGTIGSTNPAATANYLKLNVDTSKLGRDAVNRAVAGREFLVAFLHSFLQYMSADAWEERFAWIMETHGNDIWWDGFTPIVQYAQSRDTHMLTVEEATGDLIRFSLTDSMHDILFDYPLTVKVRLDGGWDSCIATQNGKAVEASLAVHEGGTYALVKAVPDRGEVVLSKTAVSLAATPVITPDGGSSACSVRVSISCPDASADIYFTTDGSSPDSAVAMPYAGPFSIWDDAVIKAVAYCAGTDLPSREASASFAVVTEVEDVVISPAGGRFDDTVRVTLGCGTAGAVIRYTLDGSDPDEADALYTEGLMLTDDAVVTAKAFHACLAAGGTASASFTVDVSGIGTMAPGTVGLPPYSGNLQFYDCNGIKLRTPPQIPGIYFFYKNEVLRKAVIVD